MSIPPKLLGRLAWWLVRVIVRTMRIETVAPAGMPADLGRDGIYVLWHGRLFFPLVCFRDRGIVVLVSEHRDGEIITASLEAAGCDTVRGSTTRGGSRALVEMIKIARRGIATAFTPDGPRGPRWKFQPGAVFLAAKTGLPIIPLGGSANRAYYFSSWDRFQLPLPFSRGVFVVGEPYYVTGGLDDENIEYHRCELERRLTAVNREADRIIGAHEPA